jgi:hypothetical protein
MEEVGKENTFSVFANCKIENLEKKPGSYILRATFRGKGKKLHTILCPSEFENELRNIKELDSRCRLVFKQYKKHLPYLVSLEIPE